MNDKDFVKKYKILFSKYGLFEANNNFYNKNKPIKRCSWEEDAKSLRPKYEKVLSKNENDIFIKNYFNKLLCNMNLINVTTDGGLISAVRGLGYLHTSRGFDDMDIVLTCDIPLNVIKNRLIDIPEELNDSKLIPQICAEDLESTDECYRNKVSVLYLKYKLITECNVVFDDRINNDSTVPFIKCNFTSVHSIYVDGTITYKNVKTHIDLVMKSMDYFTNMIKKYGNLGFVNIHGQDSICFEGAHKYLFLTYGPTYMIPLSTAGYDGAGLVKAPFIDEVQKEFGSSSFKPIHSSRKYWKIKGKKYLDRVWTAPKLKITQTGGSKKNKKMILIILVFLILFLYIK